MPEEDHRVRQVEGAVVVDDLCGLDFGGGYYFKRGEDGEQYRCEQRGVWGQLDNMNLLTRDCEQRGMKIYTLSETELDVPYAD